MNLQKRGSCSVPGGVDPAFTEKRSVHVLGSIQERVNIAFTYCGTNIVSEDAVFLRRRKKQSRMCPLQFTRRTRLLLAASMLLANVQFSSGNRLLAYVPRVDGG